jgi:hypothetical protein
MTINPFKYLTLWSLFFVITPNILNTRLLTLIVSVFGLYITYKIKKLVITDEIVFTGKTLVLIDLVFHQLPFLYVWLYTPSKTENSTTLLTVLFVSVYMLTVDIMDVYKFKEKKDVMYLICLITLIYVVYNIKHRLS